MSRQTRTVKRHVEIQQWNCYSGGHERERERRSSVTTDQDSHGTVIVEDMRERERDEAVSRQTRTVKYSNGTVIVEDMRERER